MFLVTELHDGFCGEYRACVRATLAFVSKLFTVSLTLLHVLFPWLVAKSYIITRDQCPAHDYAAICKILNFI